jgi:predicted alpha/beta hydrolase
MAPKPLDQKSFRTLYCQGDRSPEVVRQWNEYCRVKNRANRQARSKNGFDESKLKRPKETYSANWLYKLGCREEWVMKAVAEKARKYQKRRQRQVIKELKALGLPSVKTWKGNVPEKETR